MNSTTEVMMVEELERPLSEEVPSEGCQPCAKAAAGERVPHDKNCAACVDRVMRRLTERLSKADRPPKPAPVDFSFVPAHQMDMHGRLENWGRACNGGVSDDTAPMFRQHQSAQHWSAGYGQDVKVPTDRSDAAIIGRGMYYLPGPHMKALQWYYVQRTSILEGRRALAATAAHLARLVIDGRQMLINRGV